MEFMPWLAIKGKALADFNAEFTTPEKKRPEEGPMIPTAKIPK